MSPVNIWTDAMIERLCELRKPPNLTPFDAVATIISAEFGVTVTRNACIGKSNRVAIPRSGPWKKVKDKPRPNRKQYKTKPKPAPVDDAPPVQLAVPPPPPIGQPVLIEHIGGGRCKWPLGAVEDTPPYWYCGKKAPYGVPYCKAHSAVAYGRAHKTWS